MGKPSAPDPPDYAAAAEEQGKANVNSAIASNFLNQANQVGPTGSLTYSYDQSKGYKLPDGTWIPQTTATTVLSPEQQKLYDQQTGISTQLNDLASQGIGYVADASKTPIDQSGLPSLSGGLARTTFNGTAAPTENGIQGRYDFSNLGAMPSSEDFGAQRDQVTQAMMDRMQPYIDRDRAAMQTKLANQGITMGSEAYGADGDMFNRGVNDQRLAAIIAGSGEQQRLFQNAMGIRSQGVGEAVSQGNFRNAAQGQEFEQNQQALNNTNSAAQANFGQGLASAQFGNQARSQAIQEADYFKNQPLNMLNALRSGNQVMMPQFGNVSGGSQIAPAPIYQASSDQYSAAMQQYQAKLAQQSAMMGGVAGIGGAALMGSDRRLKKGIKLLGRLADGLGLYAYSYRWNNKRRIGVMADEVAVLRPYALGPTINGFGSVNYGAL